MSNQPPTRELLDVEDDDARQERIRSLLENTNAAAATRPRLFPALPPSRPHPVPLSDLISRAEAFLPRLAASNAELAHRAGLDPTSVDIEHLGENPEGSHIEMNLGLGVFEQRPRPGHGPGNRCANENEQPSDSSSVSSSDSDSEDGKSSEDDTEDSGGTEDSDENEDIDTTETVVNTPGTSVLSSDYNANSD